MLNIQDFKLLNSEKAMHMLCNVWKEIIKKNFITTISTKFYLNIFLLDFVYFFSVSIFFFLSTS